MGRTFQIDDHRRSLALSVLQGPVRVLALAALLACTACAAVHRPAQPDRVLFVGNSLIYVGNAPATYAALATANGRPTTSDIIVRGGATLTQRMEDGSVGRALANGGYAAVILQERGGDLVCSFGPDSCVESRAAIKALADLARQHGSDAYLLGTWQGDPRSSRHIVEREAEAAADAGIPYIELSETLQRLRQAHPDLVWFAPDGAHPGQDLTLLQAVLIHTTVHGTLPEAAPLKVIAPIYGTSSGLTEALRAADALAPLPETPDALLYPADVMRKLLDITDSSTP